MRKLYEREKNESQILTEMTKSYKLLVLQIKRDFGLDEH